VSARGAAGRDRSGGGGLLGRERERAELEVALAEARSGHGQFCLLAGEAGIGKSSLAGAIAAHAEDEGMAVRWGAAWEGGGAPAFWPWVQVLRGLCRDRDADRLRAQLGAGAAWVAQIVPELCEALPEVEAPGSIDTDQARFALFDAIATFLRNAAHEQPLAVVLDDLHAADPPSVLMLDFVARNVRDTPMFLLAAYRDSASHARPEIEAVIAELAREGRRISLPRLGVDDLAELVELRAGVAAPAGLAEELHAATEGNPFFASEVVRLLAAEGQLQPGEAGAARLPLPDTIRDTVRRRFEPLGPEAVEMLATAAVIGREFRLVTLEAASGTDREDLIMALGEALAAGLVHEVRGTPGHYRFTHGLMRETLYGDIPPDRRARVHGAVGAALETLHAGDLEPRLAELAHHYLEAAQAGHGDKALDFATRAGERALRLLAYEQADRFFEGALGALDLGEPDPRRRAELLLALGGAQVRAGDDAARATLQAAAAAARTLELPVVLARSALAFRAFARIPGVVDEEVVGLLEEALEALGPKDDALRARLLVRLAVQLYDRFGAAERRRELVDEAIATARRLRDPAALAYVLSNAQLATWSPDTREEALAWSREVIELGERARDIELVRNAHNRLVDFLLELDDLPGADVEIEALARIVAESPEPRARAHLAVQRARRAAMEGRLDDAARLTDEGGELGERAGDTSMRVVAAGLRFNIAWMRGRLPEIESMTRRYADALPGMHVWRAALARVYCAMGREPEARREYERMAADEFASIQRNDSWLLAIAILAEVCAQLGDAERAPALAALLEPFADRNVVSIHSTYAGPVRRYLGLLAAVRGDWDAAEAHLDAARVAADRAAARAVAAMIELDRARMLVARGEADDRARAAQAAAAAAELAEGVGSSGLAAEAEALAAELGAEPATAAAEAATAARTPTQPAASGASAADAAVPAGSLRREGDMWVFDYEGRAVRVRDSKGLRYLARLLESPGVEIHALELVGAGDGGAGGAGAAGAAEAGLTVQAGDEGAGPLLDAEAKAAYRERLEGLREELEEAESFNDPERAARAREEMEFIARELAGAVGLGGRDRKTGSNAERARVNVTRSIRGVMKRIADFDADLGRELEATVRTGTFCAYEPDLRRPVSWTIARG
jgi:AAA ATPase domain